MTDSLWVDRGGRGDPVLLLLHGMGGTADVWAGLRPLLAEHWPGRWIAPDLPGHGRSRPLAVYSFDRIAEVVVGAVPETSRVGVLGHSLGGVIALTIAQGVLGIRVESAVGLGIKVEWSEDDLARARSLAARPNAIYSTRAEAVDRHLKVTGLVGLVSPDAVGDRALVERDGGWSIAFDPAAFAMGAPDMRGLLARIPVPVTLAAGEKDPMSPIEQLRRLVPAPVILPGLGHNAHVQDPAALIPLLLRLAG